MTGNRDVRPLPKRTKRRTRATVAQCDKVFGLLVRGPADNPHPCVNCGTRLNIQCAHGFTRAYHSTRWDTRNAFPLCKGCHLFFTHRPIQWDDWLRARWGDELYNELRLLAVSHARVDKDALLAELRARTA